MNELVKPEAFNLDQKQAEVITKDLVTIISERDALEEAYNKVLKLDLNDPKTAIEARTVRFKIRDNRTKGLIPWHAKNKEFYLRGGQFVDALKKKEEEVNKRMESNLEEIEKHQERLEAQRVQELHEERLKLFLAPMSDLDPVPAVPELGKLDQEVFDAMLEVKITQRAERDKAREKEELRKAEEERKRQLNETRKQELLPFWDLVEDKTQDFSDISEKEFKEVLTHLKKVRAEKELELEKARAEAKKKEEELERLRKEQAKQIEIREARSKELRLLMPFIKDFDSLISQDEKEYRKEVARLEKELTAKLEFEKQEEEKRAKELEELEKLRKLEKEVKPAPSFKEFFNVIVKGITLEAWIEDFRLPISTASLPDSDKKREIVAKFEGFKSWAKKL
jgi:hypothetical protein